MSVLMNIYRNLIYLIKNKICIDTKRLWTDICKYICRICKKLYTYNYYSFNQSDFLVGTTVNIIFFVFIWSNFIYIVFTFSTHKDEKTYNYKIIYLLAFESHLFLEIFCPIYYKGMSIKESFKQSLFFFFYSNCASTIYF